MGCCLNLITGAQPKAGTGLKMQTVSFFQRYIVRDILLTEIYRWLIEILSAILKSTRVVRKRVILAQSSNYQKYIKKTNKIPDYARDYRNEYLFIRGIDTEREKFVKILDQEGEIFKSSQANKIKLYFNKFLKAQEIEYLNDISELYFKEKDVRFIETLELQLDDYMDLFYDPDSYEFDQQQQQQQQQQKILLKIGK